MDMAKPQYDISLQEAPGLLLSLGAAVSVGMSIQSIQEGWALKELKELKKADRLTQGQKDYLEQSSISKSWPKKCTAEHGKKTETNCFAVKEFLIRRRSFVKSNRTWCYKTSLQQRSQLISQGQERMCFLAVTPARDC